MDYELRLFQDEMIDLINSHEALPWEARRLVVESILSLVEKKADDEIRIQIQKEGINAKSL